MKTGPCVQVRSSTVLPTLITALPIQEPKSLLKKVLFFKLMVKDRLLTNLMSPFSCNVHKSASIKSVASLVLRQHPYFMLRKIAEYWLFCLLMYPGYKALYGEHL